MSLGDAADGAEPLCSEHFASSGWVRRRCVLLLCSLCAVELLLLYARTTPLVVLKCVVELGVA